MFTFSYTLVFLSILSISCSLFPLVILHRIRKGEKNEQISVTYTVLYIARLFTATLKGHFLIYLHFLNCTEALGDLLMGT